MISEKYLQHLQTELQNIDNEGLYKRERIITSAQSAEIVANGKKLLNFCANNYLGLSDNVTYFVEQIDSIFVDQYHYLVIFRPTTIIPDIELQVP